MTVTTATKPAAAASVGASLPVAEPETVGMSSARLARIVTALNAEIEAGRLPGAVVAVARRGHLVFHEAVGHLGPDRRAPMPRDALFAIASMTKPVTGVAALMLWEEGRLGLADPIERFLPQLGNRRVAVLTERVLAGQGPIETVPAARSITLQDLMRHTSGLTYGGRGTTAVHALYPASSNAAGATPGSRGVPGATRGRAAAVSARHRLGLRAFHRRHRPGGGGDLRPEPGRVPGTAAVPPARHGGHRVSGAAGQGGAPRPSSAARPRYRRSRSRCRIAPRRCASNAAAGGWRPPRSITSASRRCCWAAACSATPASWAARPWRRCGPTA